MDTEQFKKLPREQRHAIWRLFKRGDNQPRGQGYQGTFREFIERADFEVCGDAVLIHWCGMWLGIERDGYTHS